MTQLQFMSRDKIYQAIRYGWTSVTMSMTSINFVFDQAHNSQ